MLKKLLIIPAIVFMSQGVFADDHGQPPPQQDDGYYDQQQDQQVPQQPGGYGGGAYGGVYGGGVVGGGFYGGGAAGCCGTPGLPPAYPAPCCGVVAPLPQPLPPPPPPPVVYNPSVNYYGCAGCMAPAVPYGSAPLAVVPRAPIYGGVYGRPYVGRPGIGPRPFVRRMSAEGCAVEQGNNGVFQVISVTGEVLYQNDSTHADKNADYMKTWYEKNHASLCGGVDSSANKSLDI